VIGSVLDIHYDPLCYAGWFSTVDRTTKPTTVFLEQPTVELDDVDSNAEEFDLLVSTEDQFKELQNIRYSCVGYGCISPSTKNCEWEELMLSPMNCYAY